MKSTIEIIIRKNEGGTFYTEVTARGCKRKDVTFAGLMGAMALVVNDMDKDMSEAAKKRGCESLWGPDGEHDVSHAEKRNGQAEGV